MGKALVFGYLERKKEPKKERYIYIYIIILYNNILYFGSFQGVFMARSLKMLESLPLILQEMILEELSSVPDHDNEEEIQIDGKMYKVPKEVIGLIDGLIVQLEMMKSAIRSNKG